MAVGSKDVKFFNTELEEKN